MLLRTVLVIKMVSLVRWSSCSSTSYCRQVIKNENNTTDRAGLPVFRGIGASQTEVKRWYTTRTYKLKCCVISPQSEVEMVWYKDGHSLTYESYRQTIEHDGQVLSFNDIRMSDAGNYTCVAKNAFGNVSHSFLVKVSSVFLLQKPVVMLPSSQWSVFVGNNITISCKIEKSTLKPLVMWFLNTKNGFKPCIDQKKYNVTLFQGKEEHSWLSKLTIWNVTLDDKGNYTCIARNGAGSGKSAQETGTLIVFEFEPKTFSLHAKNQLPPNLGWTTVGMILPVLIIMFVCMLWKIKKSRSHDHRTHFPINDQLSFTKHDSPLDNNALLFHEDEMHIEIPRENLQLLRHAPGAAHDSDIDFDVFLSYSSLDRDFVKNCLYTELTTTHSVCIDFKDFQAGLFITDNIANSVFRSRKTLLVITRNFLKGVWTFFEMQLAQGRLSEGHNVLILVVVENIPVNELPKPLQHYRKMKTYLEYFNEDVKPHFWDRLRSAIGPSLRRVQPSVTAEKDDCV